MFRSAPYQQRFWLSFLLPAVLLGLWQLWATAGIDSTLFATPAKVWASFQGVWKRGLLADALGASLKRGLLGFGLGLTIGLGLALLNGLSRHSERLTDTTIKMIHAVPSLAVVPLFIIWFGIGELSKILLIAFATFSIVYISALQAIKNTDPRLVEMARCQRLGRFATIRDVILPGALPGILEGLRYGLAVSWFVLIAAETIGTDSGIGFLAAQARDYLQTGLVFVCVLIYAALGLVSDAILGVIRRRLLGWHPPSQTSS